VRGMRFLLAVALPLAAIAGCGGGGASGESLSREEFVTRANEICRDAAQDATILRNPKGDEETAEALDAAAAAVRDLSSRLRDLSPPSELADNVEALLQNGGLMADTLDKAAEVVRKDGRLALLGINVLLTEMDKESDRLARRIGATACIGPD
jgi:hypothetical protein